MWTDRQTGTELHGGVRSRRKGKGEQQPLPWQGLSTRNWQGGMFLCSLPQGCSVHPSWHGHRDPLLISTQNHHTRSELSSALPLPMGLSSSPGIFRELCSSTAFGLREVTPGQQADGAGEMGEPHKWRVPMLLCTAVCPKTQPNCASVSLAEGGVSSKVTRLLETPIVQCWGGGRSVQTFHRFLWSRSTLQIPWPWDAHSRAPEFSCFVFPSHRFYDV